MFKVFFPISFGHAFRIIYLESWKKIILKTFKYFLISPNCWTYNCFFLSHNYERKQNRAKKQRGKIWKKISDFPAFFIGREKRIHNYATEIFDIELSFFLDWSQEKEKHLFQLNFSLIRFVFSQTFESDIVFLKIMLAESRNGQENIPFTILRPPSNDIFITKNVKFY